MNENTPDDIAVLCSHVNVERGRYHVFSRDSARVTQSSGLSGKTSDSPESIQSPSGGTSEAGVSVSRPGRERRVLRSILRDMGEAKSANNQHNPTYVAEHTISVF